MADKKVISLDQLKLLAQRVKSEDEKVTAKITNLKGSEIENDLKWQTDTEVAAAIAAAPHLQYKIVESTAEIQPESEGADKYIYLVKQDPGGEQDAYDEYMVIEQKIEKVGDWDVNLSNYVQKHGTDRLMTAAEGEKLEAISDEANKVEKGTNNGEIKIDGVDTVIYTLPETVLQETDIADDASVASMLDEVFGGA